MRNTSASWESRHAVTTEWSANRRKATYLMGVLLDLRDDLDWDNERLLPIVRDTPFVSIIDKGYDYFHIYGEDYVLNEIKRDIGLGDSVREIEEWKALSVN
jgi:hypothetical protein